MGDINNSLVFPLFSSVADELTEMFTKSGFVQEQNHLDRRLQVNRGKLLQMYRVWIQARFLKPRPSS